MYRKFELNNEGINVLLIAGIHGNEIGTIKLAHDLITYFDNKNYIEKYYSNINKIYIIPVANVEGMRSGTRDQVSMPSDLNRGWNSDNYNMRNTINNLINKSDVVIDLHSSEFCASMVYLDIEMNNAPIIAKNLEILNINYCVQSTQNDTIKRYVDSLGKVALTWEQRGINRIFDDINASSMSTIVDKLLPALHKFVGDSNYHDEVINPKLPVVRYMHNHHEGVFSTSLVPSYHIIKGQTIGYIKDLYGNIIETIISPVNGTIITSEYQRYLKQDSIVFMIQPDSKV